MSVRLNVNLNDESAAALRGIAAERELSITEAVRQAISWYKFIDEEVVKADRKVQLVDKKDTTVITDVAVVS